MRYERPLWTTLGLVLITYLACGLLFGKSQAGEAWDNLEIAEQGIYEGLRLADWLQTRYIAEHPSRFYEGVNPILGKHPSKDKVDLYFLATTITQAYIANNAPRNWRVFGIDIPVRKLWISSGIGLEYSMVNKNIGVSLKMEW